MMRGEYKAAREIWSRQFRELSKGADRRDESRIGFLPMIGPMMNWPELQTRSLEVMMVKEPEARALVRFYMAMSLIEEGSPGPGARLINTLIREDPSARINVLARFNYSQVSDEPIEIDFEFDYIPLDLNAPEKPEPDAAAQPAGAAHSNDTPK